jgi:hypothetical protein
MSNIGIRFSQIILILISIPRFHAQNEINSASLSSCSNVHVAFLWCVFIIIHGQVQA